MGTHLCLINLKAATNRVLDHIIERCGVETVEIETSFYWDIDPKSRYNMNEDPDRLDVGSLEDDWNFSSSLLSEETQPLANQLTELAPLLLYVGEVLGQRLGKDGG